MRGAGADGLGLSRQVMAEGARQAKPERPRELGVLQVDPDRLPTARTGPPSGVARMIHPPPVRPEEPIAVTPHDGICGGESQQWLSYPTNPLVRFCAGGAHNGHPYRDLGSASLHPSGKQVEVQAPEPLPRFPEPGSDRRERTGIRDPELRLASSVPRLAPL
jgi:hypothetical protein